MTDEHTEPPPEMPTGADEFVKLCNRLYFELGEPNGGPLHVELEDGNTEFLIGDHAEKKIRSFRNALTIIKMGNAPDEFDYRHTPEYTNAHFYQDKPEALRCAIDILNTSKGWTEEQVSAVYLPWSRKVYNKGGR
jgi:hypothetical protein